MEQSTYQISSERAIQNLIAQYTHFLDKGDFAGVAKLFKHGKITSVGLIAEGSEVVEHHLHENLQVYPDGTPRTAHVTTNTLLHINATDDSATASSYMTIFQQDEARSFQLQPITIGRYEDTFSRIDGEWYFTQREVLLTLMGDLSHHARADGQAAKNLQK